MKKKGGFKPGESDQNSQNQQLDNRRQSIAQEISQQTNDQPREISGQSNVVLKTNSSHSMSVASFSMGQSSSLSSRSMRLNSQRTSRKVILKQAIHFGNEPKILKNRKNTNRVRTKRYTMLSWAPLSLLFQFKRAANIYFLVISVLTAMPFSPKEPSSMIGTFAMVLFFTMLKEAYEDYQRHKQDKEVNKKKAKVFDSSKGKFVIKSWDKIQLGQLVRIEKEQEVPADLLVLYSSNVTGLVFVDTMNLDGETNLKEKIAICENFNEKQINEYIGEIQCDTPNEHLEFWEGNIQCQMISAKVQQLNIKNLLLRGCYIRNTQFVYGIVVYTGMETKIMKNMKKPPHKVSNVMKKMNFMLYTVFLFQISIIFLFAALNTKWNKDNLGLHPETNTNNMDKAEIRKSFVIQLLTFWVAYSHMIPISLYVIIELLKLGQAYLINKDIQIYDKETESFSKCRNSDLIEELGQVEMIFSDKTGTLTMNKMVFKKCQINGNRYGDANAMEQMHTYEGMCQSGVEEIQKRLKDEQLQMKNDKRKRASHMDFFKAITLCHTIVCDIDPITKEIRYQGSSPDELALVNGAKEIGIELVARNHGKLELENRITDHKEIYKVVAEFPFDSTRKCMSVIVQDQHDQYAIYCKGADSVVSEKINFDKSSIKNLKEKVEEDLHLYSCEGLRTLMVAMRSIPEQEFNTFNDIYTKLQQSNHPYKEKKIKELYSKMEQKLRYLGCTAIEDKLQEGVPSTIAKLIEADIRFWMLTGDKLETAIEIAKSCRVIQEDMHVLTLSTNDFEAVSRMLDLQIEQYDININQKVKTLKNFEQQNMVIAIDGSTLNLVLEDPELEQKFFYVSLVAKSVVCCRVSPKQKADVVALFKKRGQWITLSIGDGANDVSMILEAHIGIGIKGKEGTQAVRSADYSISQFRFLQKLLLLHGRWGYRRVSKMICYYFYKNIILVFTEIYFAFFNGFSGQIFFLDWLPMLYNAVFTSWQCLFAFLLEQDSNTEYTYKYPTIYKAGQQGRYFTFGIFWRQIFFAIWHGIVCFFVPMLGCSNRPVANGQSMQHWFASTVSFTIIIHLVCYKLFVESNYWNTFSFISAFAGILFYYLLTLIGSSNSLSNVLQPQLNGIMMEILTYPLFYLLLIAVPFICLIPDFTYKYGRAIFSPYPGEIVMIKQKQNPQYTYYDEMLKKDITKYLSGVIKRNQSVGHLTSKVLSEMDRQSQGGHSYENLSHLHKSPIETGSPGLRNMYGQQSEIESGSQVSKTIMKQKMQKLRDQHTLKSYLDEKNTKGVDNSLIMNESHMSDNDLNSSSSFFRQAQAKQQNLKLIKLSDMKQQEDTEQQQQQNINSNRMRTESYKERKKRLKMKIRNEQKQQNNQNNNIVRDESFHDTRSNNQKIVNKLDELINESKVNKTKKGKVKQDNLNLFSIFDQGTQQHSKANLVPPKIFYGENKETKYEHEQLKLQGHPLEKSKRARKGSKKRYVEKYRQLVLEEKSEDISKEFNN